jgi:hypothetical protein
VARIEIQGSDLVLKLSVLEKVISFGGNRRVPVAFVHDIEEVPRAGSAARDTPTFIPRQVFGTMMPGVVMYGTIMKVTGWDLLAVVGDRPGVRVEFSEGSPFNRLIASVRDPKTTVELIRGAFPGGA